MIIFGERDLRKMLRDYLDYYYESRTHPAVPPRNSIGLVPLDVTANDAALSTGRQEWVITAPPCGLASLIKSDAGGRLDAEPTRRQDCAPPFRFRDL